MLVQYKNKSSRPPWRSNNSPRMWTLCRCSITDIRKMCIVHVVFLVSILNCVCTHCRRRSDERINADRRTCPPGYMYDQKYKLSDCRRNEKKSVVNVCRLLPSYYLHFLCGYAYVSRVLWRHKLLNFSNKALFFLLQIVKLFFKINETIMKFKRVNQLNY